MKIPFFKMSGSGNDFIVIDNRNRMMDAVAIPDFVRAVCRRNISLGADGVILIELPRSSGCDFSWRFFNADGSEADMCGNGGRCAARFAVMNGLAGARLSFETRAGIVHAEINGNYVKIELPSPRAPQLNLPLKVNGTNLTLHFIDTGVPHAVVLGNTTDDIPVCELGKKIRFHPQFQPAGTNVNFVAVVNTSSLRVRTYERGVEDETLACGTGAVAAALITSSLGLVVSPTQVETRGGEFLTVYYDRSAHPFGHVYLQGPVRVVCSGELWEEAYT